MKIPGHGQVLINEVRVAQSIGARRGSVAVCERSWTDKGIYINKGGGARHRPKDVAISPVSVDPHWPGKVWIVACPASTCLRHIAVRDERPERRSRGEPGDAGDLPAAHHRADDAVVGVEHAPPPERQFVSVERVQ